MKFGTFLMVIAVIVGGFVLGSAGWSVGLGVLGGAGVVPGAHRGLILAPIAGIVLALALARRTVA